MKLKKVTLTAAFMGLTLLAQAQQSDVYTHGGIQYEKAFELYANGHYAAAQREFQNLIQPDQNNNETGAYYAALCALKLKQTGADKRMENFLKDYPASVKRQQAYLTIADYYFESRAYPKALSWYNKTDRYALSGADRSRYHFHVGYCQFHVGDYKAARPNIHKVLGSKEYGQQAKYYYGHMAYAEGNYQTAMDYFVQVKDVKSYAAMMPYYELQILYAQEDYEGALAKGEELIAKSKRRDKKLPMVKKIVGESLFNLGRFEEAIPYLKEYRGNRGKWSNTDYYQLGFAYYSTGDYENALKQFNRIISSKDEIGQNAYYLLADCYMRLDQKPQALNAFKASSEMEFDQLIQKDARYNYVKLSYEIGNAYESTPQLIKNFLADYPNTPHEQELLNYLMSSFLTSGDYAAAVQTIEEMPEQSYKMRLVLQKATFFRGTELFAEGKYNDALEHFDISLENGYEATIRARTQFWKAETLFKQGKYEAALALFKEFQLAQAGKHTSEGQLLDYELGYVHFKMKNYETALASFMAFDRKGGLNEEQQIDTWLRIGDCNFAISKFWPALENYNKVLNTTSKEKDYAHYQKGVSYGLVDRNEQRISTLNEFLDIYPKSAWRDDAMYELGIAYLQANNATAAIGSFLNIEKDNKKSALVPKAKLKAALIYYNSDQSEQALALYKNVVAKHQNTAEARTAVSSARKIYVDLGRVDEYVNWTKGISFVNLSNAEVDSTKFEVAERQFMKGDMAVAESHLTAYLQEFPEGMFAISAHYYLGQAKYELNKVDEALPHFMKVLESSKNENTEPSLVRAAEILIANERTAELISVLERLEDEADYEQNQRFAQSNLMKAYYQDEQYDKAVAYANTVMANDKHSDRIHFDAKVITARAAIKTNNEKLARKTYAEVQKTAKGEVMAEALYYDAYFLHKEKKYQKSMDQVSKLAAEYSGYKYWGAKGLVIMAQDYYAMDDAYQATYILETVIENFDYPDVLKEAQAILQKIKKEEAKTNESVSKEDVIKETATQGDAAQQ